MRKRLAVLARAVCAAPVFTVLAGAIALLGPGGLPGIGPAFAQSPVTDGQPLVTARVIPGAPEEDGARLIGIDLELAPGWKTYWRSPGEAGIPPVFDWSGSGNVADAEVFWPAPGVFRDFGVTTVGYEDRVTFPVRVAPVDPSAPIDLDLTLDLGVCREVCVFERTALMHSISADETAGRERVAEAMALVPASGIEAGLRRATCVIGGAGRERSFSAGLVFDREVADPTVLLEGPEGVWFHSTRVMDRIAGEGGRVDVEAALSLLFDDVWVSRGDVRLTVLADGVAADIQGCAAPSG